MIYLRNLTYNPTEKHGDDKASGKVAFDLLCTCDNGEQIIVEMQRAEQPYFRERAVFYTSRLISEQLPKGKKSWNYGLKEVYLVVLPEFVMERSEGEYLHDYCLTDRATGQIFYKKLGYKFIELPKFTKKENQLETDLDRWLFLLKNLSKILVFLRKRKEQIEYDYRSAIRFAAQKAAKEAAEEAYTKARLEGLEAGVEAKTEKSVRNMIRKGYSDMEICEVQEITPDYVSRIRETLENGN